jgi:exodeoxyribonuclease VII large subunit
VGHETDITIADFAADQRAATPTAAAELAVASQRELFSRLADCARCVSREMRRRLQYASQALDSTARRLVHPAKRLREARATFEQLRTRLAFALGHRVHRCEAELARLRASLAGLDPTAVLARGYSITRNAAGEVVRDAAAVADGELLATRLARGELLSRALKKP